ncbi:inositol monophosphatase family protein [Staphylococcus equorum]
MKEDIEIETKSNPNDLVTKWRQSYRKLSRFGKYFKNIIPITMSLVKNGHGHDLNNVVGVVWAVDPIDGTLNFVHQKENFAISIGIYNDGAIRRICI